MLRTFTVVAGIGLTIISFLIPTQEPCRCRPFEPCWPNEAEWTTLQDSVDGNLLPLKPIGHVCHHLALDRRACEDLKRLSLDSGWRAAQPASLQDWVWEGGKLQNESCHIFSDPESNCHQGRVPLYSASVRSASHIQKAVLFAKKHNLRLVIKNTGHDGAGRSSGPSSFQIHTNKLKNLEFHEDFLAQGATESSGGPAVTIGAGVMQWEVYEKAAAKRLSLVGGECPSVGAVGGFLQGGGVSSFFSYARGLAIDNVLEYQVVTAEAEVVIANAHQNQDLFWALRGGGGGTFGIVTQATVRLFPDDPLTSTTISISSEKTSNIEWTEAISRLLATLQTMNKNRYPGQFLLQRSSNSSGVASLTVHFPNTTDTSMAEKQTRASFKCPDGSAGLVCSISSEWLAQGSFSLRKAADIYPENYGILSGSLLVSNQVFGTPEWPAKLAETLVKIQMSPGDILFTSNLGGHVNELEVGKTSLHPAWRSSAQLITFVRSVTASFTGKTNVMNELSNVQMPILYSMDEESRVSYRNLGLPSEENFQNLYWGSNYQQLLKVKRRWDKDGLFTTKLGVGSEYWDEEGLCRIHPSYLERALEALWLF
ncbi:putative oxidoreductase [Daldinia loculata]|nr:putative oxidoreductase [Daldinia loculata]